jgi:hypothetical protein
LLPFIILFERNGAIEEVYFGSGMLQLTIKEFIEG